MRALLVANADDSDAGCVGERLRHHGASFTDCHRERPADWPDLDGHELVLLLGSDWSVYWSHVADEVAAEVALVRAARSRGVPIMGICFGAQVVAHALGGSVERAPTAEIGWYDVESDEPAIACGPWMQWHVDRFVVPPGFSEIARSPVGPQAAVAGRILTTQFHPEATESILSRWTSGAGAEELARVGTTPEALLDEARRNTAVSRVHADRLVDWFLESIAGRPLDQGAGVT